MKTDALLFLVAATVVAADLNTPPALADIPTNDTALIGQYQDQAIDFTAQGSESYTLMRGGRPLDDMGLATTSGDPDLVDEVATAQRNRHLYKLSVGIVGLPLGLLIAVDNFFGYRSGPTPYGSVTLPRSVVAPFPASSPLSFALSVGGAILALYASWQLGDLVGEAAGVYHPTYLSPDQARKAVDAYDRKLADQLGLTAAQVAEATPEATPSVPPSPIPDSFPAGEEGSACWAVRQAVPFVEQRLGASYLPYLVWTRQLRDFQTGLIQNGAWHVLFAGPEPSDDVDASVPAHGGNITWTGSSPAYSQWRAGTDLLKNVRVDSPRAMFLLKDPMADRQVGWLPVGSVVVLYPFWNRLPTPVWVPHVSTLRLPPQVGIDAKYGTLVDMARYQMNPPMP